MEFNDALFTQELYYEVLEMGGHFEFVSGTQGTPVPDICDIGEIRSGNQRISKR